MCACFEDVGQKQCNSVRQNIGNSVILKLVNAHKGNQCPGQVISF